MPKSSAQTNQAATTDNAEVPVVGPREPCPCGSGHRYKACHGRAAARAETRLVARPLEGLAGELDLVAMSTLVPAATTKLKLADHAERPLTAATILPMGWPALHRADGELMIGLQVSGGSGDASRDIAAALEQAIDSAPGSPVLSVGRPGAGARLQDLIDPCAPIEVEMYDGFDYWLDGAIETPTDEVRASLERANEAMVPTSRLASVEAAYWCRIGTKEHLRWVMPEGEEQLLDAFARMQVNERLGLGPGTRYIGSFRSHGLLIAVWDLAPGDEAADLEEQAKEFRARLTETLSESYPLTSEERRVRSGLTGRQVTMR